MSRTEPRAVETTAEHDRRIAERLRAGDGAALAELYDRYGGLVYSVVLRIVRSAGDAEDVTQEVFLYAWEKSPAFDPSKGTFATWLGTLARSRGIDRLRRRQSQERRHTALGLETAADPPVIPRPDRAVGLSEARLLVQRALDGLPPEQREPIEIAYFEGLSQSEIAARLSTPLGTIKTRMRQGMIRLREAMTPLLAGESST